MNRRDMDVLRPNGFTLLEVIVVMILLALAAAMTWWPIASSVRAASIRRFTAELAEYDASERAAARSRNSETASLGRLAGLRWDAQQGSLQYSASGRILLPPAGTQLLQMTRWHPTLGHWVNASTIRFADSGQSETYALQMEGPAPSALIVLGISGQVIPLDASELPLWSSMP